MKKVNRPTRKEFAERKKKVAELFEELGSTRLVCDQLGLDLKSVHYCLHSQGIPTPREGRRANPYAACDKNREKVLQMVEDGCSLKKIGKEVGTNDREVKKFLKREGIEKNFPKARQGEDHYAWKGRLVDKDGYILIHHKGHPNARKHTHYIFEHRLVMEEHLGRILLPTEVVHHKDGGKQNNDIANLQLFASNAEHLAFELKGRTPNWSPEGKARILRAIRQEKHSLEISTQKK